MTFLPEARRQRLHDNRAALRGATRWERHTILNNNVWIRLSLSADQSAKVEAPAHHCDKNIDLLRRAVISGVPLGTERTIQSTGTSDNRAPGTLQKRGRSSGGSASAKTVGQKVSWRALW